MRKDTWGLIDATTDELRFLLAMLQLSLAQAERDPNVKDSLIPVWLSGLEVKTYNALQQKLNVEDVREKFRIAYGKD